MAEYVSPMATISTPSAITTARVLTRRTGADVAAPLASLLFMLL